MLVIGTIISTAFANPLKDTVINFSNETTIPSFFISFVALPLATKLSDVIPILIYASRKSAESTSLTFNELYRTVSVNNVIQLSVFLAVVYIRGLRWEFSSEVLVILIVCVVMGGFAVSVPPSPSGHP
ncbi:sodium/calcium exchanger NCL-like [Pistacia vera]|uniref:sodium/calcium exchanger NCL-like n=1 Tax=Pistacia vera TaxID=55513 RepID=UPI0012630C2D|nr:sodium/calcium exchanger NCL-like [Pistacia vera]